MDPDENLDSDDGFSTSLKTFAAIVTFLIMVVGVVGNFLTVAALVKCPKVRNVAAAFIISLCVADLLFCLLVLPFSGMRFINGSWTQNAVFCKAVPFIQYGNIGVSLLCIAMITINRYIMIAHHSVYARIYKTHWIAIMIAFCWIFSYGMQLPTLFGVWGRFDYDQKLETCSILADEHGHSSKTALFIIAFVIPCIVIIACYTKIFWVVQQSELRLKRHANKQNSIPNNLRVAPLATNTDVQVPLSMSAASESSFSTDTKFDSVQKPIRIKDQRELRTKRNEWRITKMVLAIFLSFVICYLPITIVKVSDKEVEYPVFHVISYLLLYMSACINPIIYVIMNKQYRKAYKTVICCEPSKMLPFGKGYGGSSVPEKWKDTGLSSNHSRTMVSQMDQTNTSLSTSPPSTIKCTSKNPPETPTVTNLRENTETSMTNPTTIPQFTKSNILDIQRTAQHPLNIITLAGGDIILEEEEGAVTPDLSETNPTEQKKFYLNMEDRRKIHLYGGNINVTPDSKKFDTKSKFDIP